jgi:phosphoglucomutase
VAASQAAACAFCETDNGDGPRWPDCRLARPGDDMSGADISPLAGKPLEPSRRIDVSRLVDAYFSAPPDLSNPAQRVRFGTSGHRGSAFSQTFNEPHVLGIAQAICLYRRHAGIDGPLFLGIDTHALSGPAFVTALEVFAANNVTIMIDNRDGYTPTPAISHAILRHNRARGAGLADGVVLTPSHNPPEDGGFKYNATSGGPADLAATSWIERSANALLEAGLAGVRRMPYARARRMACVHRYDYLSTFVADLGDVIDLERVRAAGVTFGVDPLGGASVDYWAEIIERYGLAGTVVDGRVDPTFGFMPADWDGKIRMDCSSPYAMARLIGMRDRFDLAIGSDTDADRHGVVTRTGGLMKPNHFLSAAVSYLFGHREDWSARCGVGKTVVSSSMIDRVASQLDRSLVETPVGFKWFVAGLLDGSLGFAGEESAGASLLRRDGTPWTTDKDGMALGLLALEINARLGRDPGQLYERLTDQLGRFFYERTDATATHQQMAALRRISIDQIDATELVGEAIETKRTTAPGNGAPIGGIKVTAKDGWFAARPSGTEDVYKIYAESFRSEDHLRQIQGEAHAAIEGLFKGQTQDPGS